MKPQEWLTHGDTGTSSMSIFYVMIGLVVVPTQCGGDLDIPYDSEDFGRCYRLLQSFPEWRKRLDDVAVKLPKWGPLIERWGELEALYETDRDALYMRLRELYPLCMAADGWELVRPGSWRRLPNLEAQR